MSAATAAAGIETRLVLDPLDDHSWRLRDLEVPPSDAASVVAYVERPRKGQYEVTWLARGLTSEVVENPNVLFRRAAEMLADGVS